MSEIGFGPEALRRDIVDKWGPAGAHVDVLDTLISRWQIAEEQRKALLDQRTKILDAITEWSDAEVAPTAGCGCRLCTAQAALRKWIGR